jgi:hypothetical protein
MSLSLWHTCFRPRSSGDCSSLKAETLTSFR